MSVRPAGEHCLVRSHHLASARFSSTYPSESLERAGGIEASTFASMVTGRLVHTCLGALVDCTGWGIQCLRAFARRSCCCWTEFWRGVRKMENMLLWSTRRVLKQSNQGACRLRPPCASPWRATALDCAITSLSHDSSGFGKLVQAACVVGAQTLDAHTEPRGVRVRVILLPARHRLHSARPGLSPPCFGGVLACVRFGPIWPPCDRRFSSRGRSTPAARPHRARTVGKKNGAHRLKSFSNSKLLRCSLFPGDTPFDELPRRTARCLAYLVPWRPP